MGQPQDVAIEKAESHDPAYFQAPNPKDIEKCTGTKCAFFKYRFAKDPDISESRKEQGRRAIKHIRDRDQIGASALTV